MMLDEFGVCHITAIGSGPASNFSSVGPAGIKEGLVERRQNAIGRDADVSK
jgi:hypothetical protein